LLSEFYFDSSPNGLFAAHYALIWAILPSLPVKGAKRKSSYVMSIKFSTLTAG
jgi:hypothetical protein